MANLQFHVLVLSPSRAQHAAIRAALDARAMRLFAARDIAAACERCRETPVDLIILDCAAAPAPDACPQLQRAGGAPILALVTGDAPPPGADDSLALPLCPDRLRARVEHMLIGTDAAPGQRPEPVCCDDLVIDLADRRVTRAGQPVRLTRTEWALLAELVRHAGMTRTHAALLGRVWGPTYDDATAYLHVYISRLRRKLEPDPAQPRYLLTDPGLGYRFVRPVEAPPEPRDAPPPATTPPEAESAPPLPPTQLIGRDRELADLRARIESGTRLLTLLGPGGSGKTHLALHLAAALRADGREVAFVQLADIHDPSLVASAIVEALGGRADATRAAASPRVLILDNFEHLLGAAPLVAELLGRMPALQILVTSRAPLRLRAEQVVLLDPLPVPDCDQPLSPDEVLRSPAVALFIRCARAAAPAFVLTERDAPLLAAICRRLDGLPLAIELAAPWVRVISLSDLHLWLPSLLALPADGTVDRPQRQQTLHAAVDASYALLTPSQRALFARLAVFVEGWSLADAAAVCAPGAPPVGLAADVAALVDVQLVRRLPSADGAQRFTMLETTRSYALERLDERPDAADVRDRHAAHDQALVADLLPGRADLADLSRSVAPERASARAALSRQIVIAGDHDSAEHGYNESIAIHHEIGDLPAQVWALNYPAGSCAQRDSLARARALLEQRLQLALGRPLPIA